MSSQDSFLTGRGAIARTADGAGERSAVNPSSATRAIAGRRDRAPIITKLWFAGGWGGRIRSLHGRGSRLDRGQTSAGRLCQPQRRFLRRQPIALPGDRSWRQLRHDSLDGKRRRAGAGHQRPLQQLVPHPALHRQRSSHCRDAAALPDAGGLRHTGTSPRRRLAKVARQI